MYADLPANALSPSAPSPTASLPAQSKKPVRSTLISRNVTIAGHRTSVRLEPDMWSGLVEICRRERVTLHDVCTKVAQGKNTDTSLTAAIRVHVMNYYRLASTEDGHMKAGHGAGMRMSMSTYPAVPRPAPAPLSMPPASAAASSPHMQALSQQAPPPRSPSPFMIGMSRMSGNGRMR